MRKGWPVMSSRTRLDDDVGRRADQGHQPAEQRREGHRHQEHRGLVLFFFAIEKAAGISIASARRHS